MHKDLAVKQTSRRSRKKEQTRRHIQEVAVDLFARKGFDNVTIAEISNAADVDVTTFWRHFGSKHGILYADFEPWLQQFESTLAKIPEDLGPFDAAIHALVKTPPISEPKLDWLRNQIEVGAPSAEVQAATLLFEDKVRRALINTISTRMNVDPATDARPSIIAESVFGAARWLSRSMRAKLVEGAPFKPEVQIEDMLAQSMELLN